MTAPTASDPAAEPAPVPVLPHAHAVTWGVAALPQRGPKRELSTERIVEAAIEIADADGLEAVSMGKVAARLGAAPMSLYRYVTGKDDLLLLMFDAASEVTVPGAAGTWRERLREWAAFVRAAYDAHPWLADLPPSSTPTTPNRLAIIEAGLGALEDIAAPVSIKLPLLRLLLGYIALYAQATSDADVDESVRRSLPQLVSPERFPLLAPAAREGLFDEQGGDDAANGFAFGLNRLFDGIELWLERRTVDDELPELPAAITDDKQVRDAAKLVEKARADLRAAEAKAADAVAKATERLRAVEAKAAAAAEKEAAKQAVKAAKAEARARK
ncbi:TetR/AcrR family transcriptional regulator [Agrococcus carbonis]|uniref:Regulatory protein, tetR family n=1 Tax=Agrococcus carbonis TaxID=684552 RepID=A0A1H1RM74_9MICO|nr:TetR/AcrR family transcriptional regulator [Agrococcus carbonis]SDS36079.1 regulatory protein, tetR family [Agrococcus carbonis]